MGEVTPHPAATGGPQLRAPERLSAEHDLSQFQCGKDELDLWLRQRAPNSGHTARTFVLPTGNRVVGYYALATGAVMRKDLPRRLRHNTPDQVPILVIGRLAVDSRFQGRGYGKALLRDAILRALNVSESAGVRAIVVHAIDDDAARFYKRFGFLPSPLNERTFVLPIETAKRAL